MFKLPRHITFWIVFFLFACGPVRFSTSESDSPVDPGGSSTPMTRDVKFTTTVSPPNNKLDILLVIDNSNSMLADNQKLAARLSGFVNDLAGSAIDWQMCTTVTSTLNVAGNPEWGASVIWSNYVPPNNVPNWVLKAGTSNLNNIFIDTINSIGAGWNGTDDERGIKAAWWHLWNGDIRYNGHSACYRGDAALAMVVISDEDVRSVGGIAADEVYENEFKALEAQDLPETLVAQVQDVFGMNKRFRFNSIIVKPGDSACMTSQDAEGSKAHFGRKYAELSQLTGGGMGSICEQDFSSNLNYFKDIIQTSIGSFPLECSPHNGQISYKINGTTSSTYQMQVQGMSAVFTPALPAGTKLEIEYKCLI